jgi:NADH-quinone oxidoreductase subunit L
MKITFASMLIALLALSGVPPLSGFWSKDAVIAATVLTGQLPLMLFAWGTVALTILYSLKVIGLVFYAPPSDHVRKLEEEGHHVHEAPRVMWVPYAIMAAATIAIGLAGPYVEPFFRTSLATTTTPLAQMMPPVDPGAEAHATLVATVGSLIMLAIGGTLGYLIYISGRIKPTSIVGEKGVARSIYNFLWNRWYINPAYYRAFVYGTISAASAIRSSIESKFFDRISGAVAVFSIDVSAGGQRVDIGVVDGMINFIAAMGRKFSSQLRRIQTGVAQEYVTIFALGLFALIVAVLFFLI